MTEYTQAASARRNLLSPAQATDDDTSTQTQAERGYYTANGAFVTHDQALNIDPIGFDPHRQLVPRIPVAPFTVDEEDRARFQASIDEIASRTPRFLFRAWHGRSGGREGLNTTDAITPLAFAKDMGPASIHDIPADTLSMLAAGHYGGTRVNTVFSSWSQSLPFVLSLGANSPGDSHISIVDTARLLPQTGRNTILWTSKLGSIMPLCPGSDEEFLAFGVVSGEAHKAVRFSKLVENGLGELCGKQIPWAATRPPRGQLRFGKSRSDDQEKRALDTATRIGDLFGEDFRLPMTVYLLTLQSKDITEMDRLLDTVSAAFAEVPEQWCSDPTIMKKGHAFIGRFFRDTSQAVTLLHHLVHKKYGSGDHGDEISDPAKSQEKQPAGENLAEDTNMTASEQPTPVPDGADPAEDMKTTRSEQATPVPDGEEDAESQSAQEDGRGANAVVFSKRVPKMVRELYTDMVGYENTNAMLPK